MLRRIAILLLISSCVHQAPSNYELDRRSGLNPSEDALQDSNYKLNRNIKDLRTGTAVTRAANMPTRIPSLIEKVWIYEQKIGEHWMQGTWVFLEIEEEKWLPEVDDSDGDLLIESQSRIKLK